MQATAAKFEATRDELAQMLSQLMNQLDGLRAGWAGTGAAAFDSARLRWSEDTATLNRALGDTAEAIATAGKFYTNSDEEAAARANNIGTAHITLPL
jgi:WXG100 family type VII secretion target